MRELLKRHSFVIGLFLFSFFLRLLVVLCIHTEIVSDFGLMYKASLELVSGTKNYLNHVYFLTWAYQMGHVVYQALLLSILENVTFLKIINALVTSFVVVFVYLLGREVGGEKGARIASVLYAIFPFPLFLNTVLTNQHLPMLFILMAIYFGLRFGEKKIQIPLCIVIGLLLSLSNILRTETIVIIGAMVLLGCYLVFQKYSLRLIAIRLGILLLTYFLSFQLASFCLVQTGISPNGLQNGNPTWKFVEGFNYDTDGMYSREDASLYATDSVLSKQILKERLHEVEKIPLLFLKKLYIQWFRSDLTWTFNTGEYPMLFSISNFINQMMIVLFHGLALSSLLFLKRQNYLQIFLTITIVFYVGTYLLIEIMPRYAYSVQVLEAILASITISHLWKRREV